MTESHRRFNEYVLCIKRVRGIDLIEVVEIIINNMSVQGTDCRSFIVSMPPQACMVSEPPHGHRS